MTEDLNTPMLHMRLPSRGSKILRRTTMTKQEQIEDMAKAACAACGDGYHCPVLAKNRPCDASLKYAEAVYNAGYRKTDSVRKSTAK